MNCKNCQTELEDGVTRCPNCGTENAEPAVDAEPIAAVEAAEPAVNTEPTETVEVHEPEKTGLSAGKIALLVVLAVAAIAVVVSLVLGGRNTPAGTADPTGTVNATTPTGTTPAPTIPADGNPNDVTCKGSYTVSDEELAAVASKVVGSVGNRQLTNEQLQIYYWIEFYNFLEEYYSYISYFGLNPAQPLDTQVSIDGTLTWQQNFLDSALSNWHLNQALNLAAEESGFVLSQEDVDYVESQLATLEKNAISSGYESLLDMIQQDMGACATVEDYRAYMTDSYTAVVYYEHMYNSIELTDEEISAKADALGLAKEDEYSVDVRHILVMPTSASGASTYTDEEWAAAEQRANELLNQWLSGDATEESFAAMAEEFTADPGSASSGGLYKDVLLGQMVEPFENWCFDESHQYGDYGIVRTTYGYHIMFFVNRKLVEVPTWYKTAKEQLLMEKSNAALEEIMKQYDPTVDYSAIALGNVDFATR